MTTTLLIADAARARFFAIVEPMDPGYYSGPRLREQEDLVNPESLLTGTDLFANVKSGRGHAAAGASLHGLDDHRARHEMELERRFAKRVATLAAERARRLEMTRLILVAPPRALGLLRGALGSALPPSVSVYELSSELTWHSLGAIDEVLVHNGLLEPRVPSAGIYRAPGQPL